MLPLAAVVLTAAAALAQELVTASGRRSRQSRAAITRAGEAVGRAGDTEALLRAAEQAFAAAPCARDAFAAADRARDVAAAGYRAAYSEALAGAVTCENGYPCTNGRIDPFDGVTAAFASHFELIAAVSAANAVYVDAVGIAGGDAARAGAGRVRGLAARMRDLDITVAADRWNTLVGGVSAEIDASNVLHRRATESRDAADRALVGDIDRVMETLYTAATRLARQSSPRGGGARGARGTDAADAVAAAAADRTDAALRAAVDAAREGLEALRAHIVEALTSVQDVSAGDADDDAATAALAAAPESAEDFEGWVRALNAAVRAVEQAAADAEAATRGSGSWFSRASSCIDEPHGRRRPASIRPRSRRAGGVRRPADPSSNRADRTSLDELSGRRFPGCGAGPAPAGNAASVTGRLHLLAASPAVAGNGCRLVRVSAACNARLRRPEAVVILGAKARAAPVH